LTNGLEQKAVEYIEKIDAMGGMLKAIENGFPQREIQEAAYDYQRAVESQDAVVVGVNKFQIAEDTTIPIHKVDEKIERSQIERLRAVRERRDAERAKTALAKLEDGARVDENLLPRILDCVESYVTVGEISHRLRQVWGEYREAVAL
jgi:methylmalonyl-CoA mutase N-terminal domain/subunit